VRLIAGIPGGPIFGKVGPAIFGRVVFYVMEEMYLLGCIRYIEMNPVRAGLVKHPAQWWWSSAGAHMAGAGDGFVKVMPLLQMVGKGWEAFLLERPATDHSDALRRHERMGRPLGDTAFIEVLERKTKRRLKPKKPGPKPGWKK